MNKPTAIAVLALFLLSHRLTLAQQKKQSISPSNLMECSNAIQLADTALLGTIGKYMRNIEANELPILYLQRRGDTTFCYVYALISTNTIRNNPPTAVTQVAGREVLLYTGNESVARLTAACQHSLINKYSTILHVDKLRKKYGKPPGTPMDVGYDRAAVKIAMVKNKIYVSPQPQSFPYFKYGDM